MTIKIFFKAVIVTIVISLLPGRNDYLLAQPSPADSSKRSFRLFENENLLEINLRFDLTSYFRTKPKENYLDANITFNPGKTDSVSQDIRLRTRGVFRNQYCMFAPIELNFKKAKFGYSDLDKISKLKLVPQCSSGKDKEDYVLREYIAYKLFNVLTDTSFRVRLLKVTYIDSEKKKKPVVQYGFFIEPADMVTSRKNCIRVRTKALNQKSIVPKIMDRLAIFNFMIGNYDWSIPGQHNVMVMKTLNFEPSGLGIAIPYDFDWTGLVNASYAVPAENVGTENVRERIFEGVCRSKEEYQKDLDIFSGKKEEFYKVIDDFPYINKQAKKDITDYLNGFFDQLSGKRDIILYNLMNTCKNINP
jgi:hypothetical protein